MPKDDPSGAKQFVASFLGDLFVLMEGNEELKAKLKEVGEAWAAQVAADLQKKDSE